MPLVPILVQGRFPKIFLQHPPILKYDVPKKRIMPALDKVNINRAFGPCQPFLIWLPFNLLFYTLPAPDAHPHKRGFSHQGQNAPWQSSQW